MALAPFPSNQRLQPIPNGAMQAVTYGTTLRFPEPDNQQAASSGRERLSHHLVTNCWRLLCYRHMRDMTSRALSQTGGDGYATVIDCLQ